MRGTPTVHLPGGVWRAGTRRRDVRIRTPRGHEEEWLAAHADDHPVALATGLLARCVVDLAGEAPLASAIDELTVGDREALLWHLRRAAFGERVDAVVECRACAEKLDVSLTIEDMLAEPYDDWAAEYTDPVGEWTVTYRLPTGADQTAAGRSGEVVDLLAPCVVAVDGAGPIDEIVAELAEPLGELMARRDPQAETRLTTACPACGESVVAVLDAFSFLHEELVRRSTFLLREIHTLAWHYHWSEDDILNLTADHRAAYLDLIAEAYERAPQ